MVRAEPLEAWQIDFKDVTTVAPEPEGKRQHTVEVLNIVDTGTSILEGWTGKIRLRLDYGTVTFRRNRNTMGAKLEQCHPITVKMGQPRGG
jgi:hypothetical protein